MKLSVIIPVFNEEKTVSELLKRVFEADISVEKEIIVIDDGSCDSTGKILKELRARHNFILLSHQKNRGKGSAIRTGILQATGDFVIIQDADLEYNPQDYEKLLAPLIARQAKVVYGSRILGNNKRGKLFFYLGGRTVTFLANLLYGLNITDEPTCYKAFKRDLLLSLNLQAEKFEFCPEVTAKLAKRKIKIIEAPIFYSPRSAKEGKKIKLKDGLSAVWTLIKYKFKD